MTVTEQLRPDHLNFLHSLYNFKCLSLAQSLTTAQETSSKNTCETARQNLRFLLLSELIQYRVHPVCGYYLMLTGKGIDALRSSLHLPVTVLDAKGSAKRTMKKLSELTLKESLVPHQISLNEFLLDFMDMYRMEDLRENCRISMEKCFSEYDYFRPDAVIEMPGLLLFVEQDMGTESVKQLSDKWSKYRRYLRAVKGTEQRKMIMLFVIDADLKDTPCEFSSKNQLIEKRKRTVYETLRELYPDLLDGSFEIYAGAEKEMIEAVRERIFPEKYDKDEYEKRILLPEIRRRIKGRIYRTEKLKILLGDVQFDYCVIEQGQEIVKKRYLIDNGRFQPISVKAKEAFFERIWETYKINTGSTVELSYVILNG